jgi:excisionase family DNA binding protein
MKRPKDKHVLSAEQVAARIGIGRRQIYEAAGRNAIPHQRVGQRILFYWPAVVAWLSGADPSRSMPSGVYTAPAK